MQTNANTNTKSNIEDLYELTPMQQGMLFHTLYTEDSDVYFEQFIYDLSGNLNEDYFKKSWEAVVRRHEVLRTSFQWKGISKPVQIVNRNVDLTWKNLDWSNLNEEQIQSEFKKFLSEDRAKGFQLEKAPVMRCTLIKLDNESHKFVWSFHHIIVDGWSFPILQKEVFAFYEAFKEDRTFNLPKPRPFKEFILWLNQCDKPAAERFWRKELKSIDSPTPLVIYDEKKDAEEKGYGELEIKLSSDLNSKLISFTRQNQLTLNTLIQGTWSIILSTYRDEEDVLFGGTVSGRTPLLNGVEQMVGMFINTLPVRVNVDKSKDLISWLTELQTNHIERDQFSYSSLVDIQEWSNIPRGMPLFESIIVFENYPFDKALENGIAGVKVKNIVALERTNFPFTILVIPGEILKISVAFDKSKFGSESVNRILSHFKTALETIVTNPSQKLSDISLLTQEEEHRILTEWNDTKVDFSDMKCTHELFSEQAKRTPDSIAIECEDKKLTYKELDEITNCVANYLVKKGVKPETIVGLCIERSLEMSIGLLSILKAGGAYVPIDTANPRERIDHMIADSNIKLILSTKNLSDKIKTGNAEVIFLDSDMDMLLSESRNSPDVKVGLKNLMYIIYTSGSTGIPKGVMNTHEGVANHMLWMKNYFNVTSDDIFLQKTPYSFDVSGFELYVPLICGAKLVFAIPDGHKDNRYLTDVIINKKITIIHFVTSMLKLFLEEDDINKCTSLRIVISSGEEVTVAIQNLFFSKFKNIELHDLYGPTETAIHVTYWKCRSDNKLLTVPIGKPVSNTQCYILNSGLKPVPAGVPGELHIGGVQVARGYNNREELTAERFIPDPFSNTEGSRLYKTGDLVKYLPDGNIEYMGRADNQIKLRGFRIELGEIENVLSKYPGIKKITVAVKHSAQGDKKLVAYIVADKEPAVSVTEIRKYLKLKLPEYMIPSDFVAIDDIPLTSSGKVNHRALPEPELNRISDPKKYEEPKETLELQLVKIWEKVLAISPIGITDNFFELGGHSLLALRIFGYIEKLTGKRLALSVLFDHPTIEDLAKILKSNGWTPKWKSLVAAKPGGSKMPFFCVPPAAGTALHFQELIKHLPSDQPFYILESIGLDGSEPPHTDLKEMASFYIKEIQTLQPDGPYLLGGRCFGGRVAFEMAQQLRKANQKVALLAIFDTWPPMLEIPVSTTPRGRDARHFITRAFHHLKTGELLRVILRFTKINFKKAKWKVTNKIEYIFSSSKKRLYKEIMLIHFKAQDTYIATKYPGKITLVECETYNEDYRNGWKNLAEDGFESYFVPGTNHRNIVKGPHLKLFADKLNFVLEKTHNELAGKHIPAGAVNKPVVKIQGQKIIV